MAVIMQQILGRSLATATHYTHHQVSLMVSRNTTHVPSVGLRIRPACEAGLSAGMRRERVPPQKRKKERKKEVVKAHHWSKVVDNTVEFAC